MKKLYTVLAAATAVLGASAATSLVANNLQAAQLREEIRPAAIEAMAKAPAKVVSAPVDGQWNVVGEGTYTEDIMCGVSAELGLQAGDQWTVTFEQSASDPAWYRTIIYNENSPLFDVMEGADTNYTYINVANPDKVFTAPFTVYDAFPFYNSNEDCADWTKILQNPAVVLDDQKYGSFKDGVISFPTGSFWYLDKDAGVLWRTDKLGFVSFALPGATAPQAWVELGTAHFSDGIMGTLFGGTDEKSEAFEIDVKVCRSSNNPAVYCVPNAWEEIFSGAKGVTYTPANFTFDATDAANVKISDQSTGVANTTNGLIQIAGRYLFEGFDATKDASVLADNKLTVPATGIVYNLIFPDEGPEPSWWTLGNAVPSTLEIPAGAVSNIEIADEAAEIKFYNLQGVEVAKPANGLYIMRQGKKATKVFVR